MPSGSLLLRIPGTLASLLVSSVSASSRVGGVLISTKPFWNTDKPIVPQYASPGLLVKPSRLPQLKVEAAHSVSHTLAERSARNLEEASGVGDIRAAGA